MTARQRRIIQIVAVALPLLSLIAISIRFSYPRLVGEVVIVRAANARSADSLLVERELSLSYAFDAVSLDDYPNDYPKAAPPEPGELVYIELRPGRDSVYAPAAYWQRERAPKNGGVLMLSIAKPPPAGDTTGRVFLDAQLNVFRADPAHGAEIEKHYKASDGDSLYVRLRVEPAGQARMLDVSAKRPEGRRGRR